LFVPYPLQNHLSHLGPATARRILDEIETLVAAGAPPTMAAWLQNSFGPTLCELFFAPFHELYTAGLTGRIAPQDAHKLPIDRALVRAGAQGTSIAVGYNVTFRYPARGLDHLVSTMASECNLQLGAEVTRICPRERLVELTDGKTYPYRRLLSTLPLDRTLALAGLTVSSKPDPHTSVLVLNIGGTAGPRCPDHHWLYVPESRAGFYRVGFYSNVEPSFAPTGSRHGARVSIYVERAFSSGARRDPSENYAQAVIEELRDWGWIDEVEIVDPTWVETAYTWSYPGSQWRDQALSCLEAAGVEMVGRYARWRFQGIADSIREGLRTGTLSDG
jgi:protoporphyrinogen oxidase